MRSCKRLFPIVLALSAVLSTTHHVRAETTNVVLIMADDLGWTDLACCGSDFYQSPHIDRLARDGVRFTSFYSACTVCSPTRAALLTGKYPARLHVTDWIPGLPPKNPKLIVPNFTKHLPKEETTLAEVLHDAGYASASIGKWHLGGPDYYPEHHGFNLNVAGTEAPDPRNYFAPYAMKTILQGPPGEYITDRLGEEAVKFIRKNKDGPFFLYLPHFAVHLPIQAKQDMIAKHQTRVREGATHTNAAYAAMIEGMDATVGLIRQTLDELQLADNTLIIFTSDNGGRVPTTSNAPLRVGKGSCYEGGTRVPLIVYWPEAMAARGVCDAPVTTVDLFSTILDVTGVKTNARTDGLSLVPFLRDAKAAPFDRAIFWHYPHYQHYQQGGTTPYGAVRRGDYKLIEFYSDMRVELYNIREDIGETRDLAPEKPDLVDSLREELHAWRKSVNAQMPAPNPNYDPSQPEHPVPSKS